MYREVIFVFFLCFTALVTCSLEMRALQDRLLGNYSALVRPVLREEEPIKINVSMYISYIHELDLLAQTLKTAGFMDIVWRDEYLVWRPEDYGNITVLLLPQTRLWLPDVAIENEVNGAYFFGNDKTQVLLTYDGTVTWQPSFQTETGCKVDIYKYPFDKQECELAVMPWMTTREHASVSYPGIYVELQLTNGEFLLVDTGIEERTFVVSFSSEPLDQASFKIVLQRRYMFYVLSSIIPLAAFSLLSPLALLVPAASGEKITLSVTVLLANLVFMGSLSDSIPRVADSVSVFVVYTTLQVVVSFAAVILNVALLCLSHNCLSNSDDEYSKRLEAAASSNFLIRILRKMQRRLTNAVSTLPDSSDLDQAPLAKGVSSVSGVLKNEASRDRTFRNVFDAPTQSLTSSIMSYSSDDSTHKHRNHQEQEEKQGSGDSKSPVAPIGQRDRVCFLIMMLAVVLVNVICFAILVA